MEKNNKNSPDSIFSINEKLDQHIEFEHMRMDRIESKLDKITEIIISLSKVEEKIIHLIDDSKDLKMELKSSKDQIDKLNFQISKNTNEIEAIKKIKWIIFTSLSTSFFAALTAIIINTKFI